MRSFTTPTRNMADIATDFSTNLSRHYGLLIRAIDPSEWLIGNLCFKGLMTDEAHQKIMITSSADTRNLKLLMHLRPIATSRELMLIFVETLRDCDQEHVANLFERRSDKRPMSDAHFQELIDRKSKVETILDPECGILGKLVDNKSFTRFDADIINAAATYDAKACAIIEALLRKSDCTFDRFISALLEVGQEHVAFVLTGTQGSPPIRDEFIQHIKVNRAEIIQYMDAKDSGLLDLLVAGKILNNYDRVDPPKGNTASEMNVELLRIIPRRSQAAFDRFIGSLIATMQSHIAELFTGLGGAELLNAKLIIKFRDDSNPVTQQHAEDTMIVKLNEARGDGLRFQDEIRTRKIRSIVSVDYVRNGCIAIGFKCRTLAALKEFREMHEAGELDRDFTDTYQPMFVEAGLESISVQIPPEEFDRCFAKFQEITLMTTIHRHALLTAAKSEYIVKKLVVTDELLNMLSLCDRRKQAIKSKPTERQATVLLNIISRQPDSAFAQLVDVLRQTGHGDIAEFLNDPTENKLPELKTPNEEQTSVGSTWAAASEASSSNQEALGSRKKRVLEFDESETASTKKMKTDEETQRTFDSAIELLRESDAQLENYRMYLEQAETIQLQVNDCVSRLMTHRQRLQDTIRPIVTPSGRRLRVPRKKQALTTATTQTDDNIACLPASCYLDCLPIELLEMILTKVVVKEYANECLRQVSSTIVQPSYAVHFQLPSPEYMGYDTPPCDASASYFKLASVCSSWRRSIRGWPQSNTRNWFRHRVRRILTRYRLKSAMMKVHDVRYELPQFLEPNYGFMQECAALGVLQTRDLFWVNRGIAVSDLDEPMNRQLVDTLFANPTEQRSRDFLLALKQSDQQHVVNYIDNRGASLETFGNIRPLDMARRASLSNKRKRLTEIMDSNETLLSSLLNTGCINQRMYYALLSTSDVFTRNKELLNILSKRSVADFEMCINCFEDNKQSQVSRLLRDDVAKAEEWYETDSFYYLVSQFHDKHVIKQEKISATKETHERFVKALETSLRVMGLCEKLEYIGTLYDDTEIKVKPEIRELKFEILAIMSGGKKLKATALTGYPGYATLLNRESDYVCLPDESLKRFFDALDNCIRNSDELKYRTILRHLGPTSILMDVLSQAGKDVRSTSLPYSVCFIPCYEVDSSLFTIKTREVEEGGLIMSWRSCFSLDEKLKLNSINEKVDCRKKVLRVVYAIRNVASELRVLSAYHFKMAAFHVFDANKSKHYWSSDRIGPRVIDVLTKLEEFLYQGFMPLLQLPDVNLLKNLSPSSIDVLKTRIHQLISDQNFLTSLMQKQNPNTFSYYPPIIPAVSNYRSNNLWSAMMIQPEEITEDFGWDE